MPRDPQTLIFVGIKSSVVALDARSGNEVWRAKLRGSDFVTVLWDGETLIAANSGEVFRLDPTTGGVMWHNEMKGLGRGMVSLGSSRMASASASPDLAAAKQQRNREAAAAAAAAG